VIFVTSKSTWAALGLVSAMLALLKNCIPIFIQKNRARRPYSD
jgi:hypothetical protein